MAESVKAKYNSEEDAEEEFYDALDPSHRQDCVKADANCIPSPEVAVLCVGPDKVSFGLEPHDSPQIFDLVIDYCCANQRGTVVREDSPSVDIEGLCPGTEYTFTIVRRAQSSKTCVCVITEAVPPAELTVSDIRTDSVTLSWETPAGEVQNYTVTCCSGEEVIQELQTDETSLRIRDLEPGQQYLFSVCAQLKNGLKSEPTVTSAGTKAVPPAELTVSDIRTDSVALSWETPAGEVQNYTVTCCSGEDVVQELQTDETSLRIRDLEPGQQYLFSVCAQLKNGLKSEPTVTSAGTKTHFDSVLETLGLQQHYKGKLSLNKILQIDQKTIADTPPESNTDVVWYFLKKLMMVNVTARNVKCTSLNNSGCELISDNSIFDFNSFASTFSSFEMIHVLDIITALFLCSDGFVQQELSLKMSMCQFAVPLLLPNCDTNQCTLMLWAMRDIVKKYRPQSLSESKGFIEEHIVLSEIPMISFVRLGECSLSKSEILNKILSNSQQYHDIFVHHNMECGDYPRTISNGLVEITWYLPCGNKNTDIFSEPVAVANLRGDIASCETQFTFLCQTSSAVFVFFDNLNSDCKLLKVKSRAQVFLVGNKKTNLDALREVATKLHLTKSIILKTKQMNDAHFVKKLQTAMRNVVESSNMRMQIEQMATIAHELGVHVEGDCPECKNAKQNANEITAEIHDTLKFKETQLPLQGQIWKELTSLEKEEFRLKNVGSENIEDYKSDLKKQKMKLREKQNSYDMSNAMICFINAISSLGIERSYFLKWMRINLDNLSCKKLSGFRQQYKEKSKIADNREELKKIDEQLSNSSVGTEHFFREMSQIYEASVSLPESHPSRQQLQHLPRLCAQLLLDGFPLELVDGDASNIPLRWVSDVLAQLHELVSPNNKILVVTVLGVQSTGKSTLLNTMFGVQFAVSSGRCTRGAFMLLIRISEEVKQTLNCDFLVIIDTEGLKSPELAQLDDSHEHDNELATLVVGLSDITIINIAMENAVEMKDILQIVVHAFLRMKEVGKKPKCQFVHQNVSDVSAHEKNLRDRELFLQQLDEMTQAAAKMERKEKYKSFTDVMEYNPDTGNWYIPGLWNGNPPMAPVNTGYSEAVYELKKNIIHLLEKCDSSNNILEFREWITSLWTAVKHENFIFSFRNSLVADAYMKLCTEFNKWEWDFKKAMYTWVTNAETRIKNFGTVAVISQEHQNIKQLLTDLKNTACTELIKWETTLLDKLTQYFKQKEGHVYLVEGYKQEFENSVKSLRKELESSVINELTAAADMKKGQTELDKVRERETKEIEDRVYGLIENCRKKRAKMTDEELDREFDEMWNKTVKELEFFKQKPVDIFGNVHYHLRKNLKDKGSHACEELSKKSLKECGLGPYKYTAEGWKKQAKQQLYKWFKKEDFVAMAQELADRIIASCQQSVTEKVERKSNYHETYIIEILHSIDDCLNNENMNKDMEFEVSLKQHICADAARQFQKMHEDFLSENDPSRCLNKNKEKFLIDFKDVFYERDQCQKKAEEFTERCLRGAVEDFINRSLGLDIVSEMLTLHEFSTRTVFQYSVLLDLLEKDKFDDYLQYTKRYENYVKGWILGKIYAHSSVVTEYEDKLVNSCVHSINNAVDKAKKGESGKIKLFVEDICKELGDKLVISKEALDNFMVFNKADKETFAFWLIKCVHEMGESLHVTLKKISIQQKLRSLHVKPQNELFNRVIGCGKQCPFCKAPCDAGGSAHTEHWASLHRSQALGAYRWDGSGKLVTDICSSAVNSDIRLKSAATKGEWHPYKRYREIYPDWKITSDISLEASDYWKYVLAKFNDEFAEAYKAEPADIPETWKSINKEMAKESIKASFSIK